MKMTYKNYLCEYTAKDKNGKVLRGGKMRVKNRMSEVDAQVKLEAWLKKKHPDFGWLVVHKCYVDNIFSEFFGDVFSHED